MGQTKYFALVKNKVYNAFGFDSCIGVVCYGSDGVLLGHYTCRSEDIIDDGELGGEEGLNPGAAKYAIPREMRGNSLGTGVKCWILAEKGTTQARITECKQTFSSFPFYAPFIVGSQLLYETRLAALG
jgi:hypothetical protein